MCTFSRRGLLPALLIVSATALVGCNPKESVPETPPLPVSAAAVTAAGQITPDFLREHIATLSSDEFEGRAPATPGDEKTRAYLVEQLKQLGFEPGGADGSYEQAFDVVGVTAEMPEQWTFRKGGQSLSFNWREQYVAASGAQQPTGAVRNAEVVFVGYGIQAPEYEWDDFKGEDLKGKILVMLNNDPDWNPRIFAGEDRLYYGRWTYKYESAARQGAVGAIIIHTDKSAGYPFQVVQTSWTGEQMALPATDQSSLVVEGWLTQDASRQLFEFGGHNLDQLISAARSRDFKPISLGVTTSLQFRNTINRSSTANVYGVLKGSDPQLSNEYVIYTAHHDHLGVGEPNASGDTIFNGALDNASGVAQLLAIGKAFKALPQPPRRSVMLLFVAAEEQGLLGSKYYAENPSVAPGRIAANLNFDGGNIWGRTTDLVLIGQGKSTLDNYVNVIAEMQGREVKPDQYPDRGFFYRSDQFNFAKIGVPAMYLDTGVDFIDRPAGWGRERHAEYEASHYHQPSDELSDSWNFDGMIEDAQLGFYVGIDVANADEMPGWMPGDEFDAARRAAVQAVQ